MDEYIEPPLDMNPEQIEEINEALRHKYPNPPVVTYLGRYRVCISHPRGLTLLNLDDSTTLSFWVRAIEMAVTR